MKIYPAIDLINGKCVRLQQGDFDRVTEYSLGPIEQAKLYKKMGAHYLHLVDLDGAKKGQPQQMNVIESICHQSGLKVQVGGGVRELGHIQKWLEMGVDRVVIGSLAVHKPQETKQIVEEIGPDRLTLSFDFVTEGANKMVATHGWQKTSQWSLEQALGEYYEIGVNQVLITDISKDGLLVGVDINFYESLQKQFPRMCVLVSGGISNIEDVQSVRKRGIGGVIVGRAIYENKLDLGELFQC